MDDYIDVTFYAQVDPDWETRYYGDPQLRGAKVGRVTQKRPLSNGHPEPKGGTVVVKLTLRLPRALFEPIKPEAVITVPAELAEVHPIHVEATAP